MQVRHILQEKGRHVIAVAETISVAEAAQMLVEKRIGVVLVNDGEAPFAGILSERDVVRAIATDGAQALLRPVSSYMTRNVATCGEADTVACASIGCWSKLARVSPRL